MNKPIFTAGLRTPFGRAFKGAYKDVRAEDLLWQHLTEHYPRIPGKFSAADLRQIRSTVVAEFPNHGHDFRFLRKKVLETLAREAGYSIDIVEPAFAVFDHARNDVDLFPDVLPHLRTLAENFEIGRAHV